MSELPVPVFQSLFNILGPPHRLEHLQRQGLSQASLWKWQGGTGCFVIKRHPSQRTSDRTAAVHRFRLDMRQRGIEEISVPEHWGDGSTLRRIRASDWEFMRWMPGCPLEKLDQITNPQLEHSMMLIAKLHRFSLQSPHRLTRSSGIENRLQLLKQYHESWKKRDLSTIADKPQFLLFRPFVEMVIQYAPRILEQLNKLRSEVMVSTWIPRDLHRDHLFFQGDAVSAIIDLDAADVEWPVFDLVRFLGTTLSINANDRWKGALELYENSLGVSIRPPMFLETWKDWILFLSCVSILLSALFWIEKLYNDPLVDVADRLRYRLEEFQVQLEHWSHSW